MEDTEKENNTESRESKKSATLVLIGISLVILGLVIAYIALSQPKVSIETEEYGYSAVTENHYSDNAEITENRYSDNTEIADDTVIGSTHSQTSVQTKNTTRKAVTTTKQASSSVSYPLNLNTCTAAELMTIDMIGEVRANSIIAYRDYLGGYTSVEQLKNISGIGDSVYAAIEPYVTV